MDRVEKEKKEIKKCYSVAGLPILAPPERKMQQRPNSGRSSPVNVSEAGDAISNERSTEKSSERDRSGEREREKHEQIQRSVAERNVKREHSLSKLKHLMVKPKKNYQLILPSKLRVYEKVLRTILDGFGLSDKIQDDLINQIRENIPESQNIESLLNQLKFIILEHEKNSRIIKIQKLVRRWLAIRRVSQLKEQRKNSDVHHRREFLNKLMKEETQYIEKLSIVQNKFLRTLQFKDKPIIPISDIKIIFGNIDSILLLHKEFLKKLENFKQTDWPNLPLLGQKLYMFATSLKLYGDYASNYHASVSILETSVHKSSKFSTFVIETEKENSCELSQLLALPVERPSLYSSWVEELSKNCQQGTGFPRDTAFISKSSAIFSHIEGYISSCLDESKRVAALLTLQRKLVHGKHSLDVVNGMKTRELIKEGPVLFSDGSKKKNRPGQLSLLSDLLLISSIKSKDKIKLKYVVPLEGASIRYVLDLNQGSGSSTPRGTPGSPSSHPHNPSNSSSTVLKLEQPNESKVYFLTFKNEEEKESWRKETQFNIDQRSFKVFGSPLEVILEKDKPEDGIPLVVTEMVNSIIEKGLDNEGVFRVNSGKRNLETLKERYEKCIADQITMDWSQDDIHTICGLLKDYFRNLPEPLLTFDFYDKCLPYLQHEDFSGTVGPSSGANIGTITGNPLAKDQDSEIIPLNELKKMIQNIKSINLTVFRYFVVFLGQVERHKDKNKMTYMGLAIIFGPCFLFPAVDKIDPVMFSKRNDLMTVILENSKYLFDIDDEEFILE